MYNKINFFECGPRDGWQNLKQIIPTEQKIRIIDGLVNAGLKNIEVTSFVSPKAIPQMIDSQQIASHCVKKYPDIKLYALAPNFRGVQDAWNAGIRHITYVVSLSERHNKANVNRTHEQSLAELENIFETYPDIDVCIGYATVFGCPFEGIPEINKAVEFAKRLYSVGVRSITISDTIGIADPRQVRDTIKALQDTIPDCDWQIHIHDTRNMGMVNTLVAVECGIKTVQSTLGGLGGCPFAPGASGNVATEDLVYMFERMGYDTGVDFDKLLSLSKSQRESIDGVYSGHHLNISTASKCY